jgi:hypothetical protein
MGGWVDPKACLVTIMAKTENAVVGKWPLDMFWFIPVTDEPL